MRAFVFHHQSLPRFRAWAGVSLVLLSGLAGCGGGDGDLPQTVSVSGKVTFKGETLKEGTVMFHPQGGSSSHPATGEIGANGIYTLSTFSDSDGAVVGNHIVTVQVFPKGANPGFEHEAPGYIGIPAKYGSPTTSDLLKEVKPGANTINLDLEDK